MNRKKKTALMVFCIIFLSILLVAVKSRFDREPISTDEIMSETNWTEQQTVNVISRIDYPSLSKRQRERLDTKFKEVLKGFDKKTTRRIIGKVVDNRIDDLRRKWRVMPEEQKRKFLSNILKRMSRFGQDVNPGISGNNNRPVYKVDESPEAVEWRNQVLKSVTEKLKEDEMEILAPIIMNWVKILEQIND